jgi:hypothetical protein
MTPATVRAVSEHAYFFVERNADVEDSEVDDAVRVFEDEVWPEVTGVFGPPPVPGVDGDPRITILHADLGPALGGYVLDEDAYPKAAALHSNQREMVYLNLLVRPLGSPAYTRVLAHEFQHLIHRRHDQSEDTWVNEGLSQVAAALLDGAESSYAAFLERPDTQLNAWSELEDSVAHYDAASLFVTYLLEQTGGSAGDLAAEPADGVEGVRAFLREVGSSRSFEELVADWAVANVLDQPEGPYGYRDRDVSGPSATVVDRPGQAEGEVHQFGTDYVELAADDFERPPVLVFQGETQAPAVGAQTAASGAFWWSGLGDNIDATLTRELDLTGVQQATLSYRTWFDMERWFDYAFVEASSDGGRTWTPLAGRQTTTDDPLEVGYGPGYTGRSGGDDQPRWVDERIDLSAYAGSRVLVRFEYLTDDSHHEQGLAIDDISVPEIGFFDDGEPEVGGWERAGFRRVTEPLPQRFELRLITLGPAPAVEPVALDEGNRAEVALTGLGADYQRAIIAIVGATDGTMEPGRYRYEVTAGPRG